MLGQLGGGDAVALVHAETAQVASSSAANAGAAKPMAYKRQSSDSTLHPAPSGRPSSAPSNRSSFDSCTEDGPTSEPSRSQRPSLEAFGGAAGPSGSHATAAAALAASRPPPMPTGLPPRSPTLPDPLNAAAALSAVPPRRSGGADGAGGGMGDAGAATAAQSQAAALAALQLPEGLPAPSPFYHAQCQPSAFSHAGPEGQELPEGDSPGDHSHHSVNLGALAGLSSFLQAGGSRGRRPSTGKHPSNLEHGSTAPPGAMDELAELLLAAADRSSGGTAAGGSGQAEAAAGQAAAPAASGPRSASPAPVQSPVQPAAARGAAPRRGLPPPPPQQPHGACAEGAEPLLTSQVALLAQQLLLQQQQHGGGAGSTAAAQLRRSLDRSRVVAAAGERMQRGSRQGPPTAADLLLSAGSGGSGGQPRVASPSPVLQGLDAVSQPRFSGPAALEPVEEASPFSSIQGVYGCHLLPPTDLADPHSPEPSPHLTSRSSIDLLLDPAVPATHSRNHRHSLDTLSELLMHAPPAGRGSLSQASSPAVTVAQLLRAMPNSNASNGSSGPNGNAVRSRPLVSVRHSMDSGRGPARLEAVSRTLSTLPGGRVGSRVLDPAASYYGHISSGAMHDLANSTVTVVAGAVPVPAATQVARTTVSAQASSMVDPAAHQVTGTFETRIGTPEDSMLDPDLHDTFGAHPSYGLPAAWRPRHGHTGSGGSGGQGGSGADPAFATLSRASSGGSPAAAARGAAIQDGWRQPAGATPRRPPLPPAGGEAACGNAAAAAAAAAVAAAAAAHGHPTVYQPHVPLLPVSPRDFTSPIGQAPMLEPTTVPGQHSVTVHDPQYTIPSLSFLRQCSLARKKLERMDSAAKGGGGGYIAEAKRVLAAAVHTATAQEAAVVESSCSGAIGPLLRYLRDNKHDDAALRSGLHTLSLLVTNSPNRGIIVSFHGQAMLCEAMRATSNLELREEIVQLLWDLEAAHNRECHLESEDVLTLQAVLEATSSACIASHILHLLSHRFCRPDPPDMAPAQMQECAQRLVNEIAAHKHHLQDAAQYALGNLMSVVLGDARVTPAQRQRHVCRLLEELRKTNAPGQCQVVLTVLSCVAGNTRVRSALAHCQARRRLVEFGQQIPDPRLRARSLSLMKILHKQETLEQQGQGTAWYFGQGGAANGSEASTSPPSR